MNVIEYAELLASPYCSLPQLFSAWYSDSMMSLSSVVDSEVVVRKRRSH
jgi:hypothetical protein